MSGTKSSGRRAKEIDQAMIENLSVFTEDAYRVLGENIEKGKHWAIRIWFERMYGKPREYKDVNVTSDHEQPLFEIIYKSTGEMELENQ
jgi:hypothetical protein|tara:strand:- start:215 stop:481 length:267 start_codon:yes stop_codon:yes gene_type:complete